MKEAMERHLFQGKLLRTNAEEKSSRARVKQAFVYTVLYAYDFKYYKNRPGPIRIPIDPNTQEEVENIRIVVAGSNMVGKTSLIK